MIEFEYKGYKSSEIKRDETQDLLYGHVVGITDGIGFAGRDEVELAQAFRDSIEDYFEACVEDGKKPEKPFSGKFVVRIPPDLHRQVVTLAEAQNVSLNRFIKELLEARVSEGKNASSSVVAKEAVERFLSRLQDVARQELGVEASPSPPSRPLTVRQVKTERHTHGKPRQRKQDLRPS